MADRGLNRAMEKKMRKLLQMDDDEKVKDTGLRTNPDTLVPEPKTFPQALEALQTYLEHHRSLFRLVDQLKELLPKKPDQPEKLTEDQLKSDFLCGSREEEVFTTMFGMSPPSIALIVLDDFMSNTNRFQRVDPGCLPLASELEFPYQVPKITHTAIDLAGEQYNVPIANEFWVEDRILKARFIVRYQLTRDGGIGVTVEGSYENEAQAAADLVKEMKFAVLRSKYVKGQIIEMVRGGDFKIVDIGEQPLPVMSERLQIELEKNVINLFEKQDQFDKYGLAIKRSVILCGPPGCGKTMIERWLAAKVKGKVTTLWVTAKTIQNASDVSSVFDIARKLSPSLVIMEDLDLVSGTRQLNNILGVQATGPLGEMLNQLDGLEANEAIVLVGSTNKLGAIDEALADRPGRFDRIYEVGRPSAELAQVIAGQYLKKRGVEEAVLKDLDFSGVFKDDEFTGAQIVEIVKGAIFEAIHRGCPVNQMCLKQSREGLVNQRKMLKGE